MRTIHDLEEYIKEDLEDPRYKGIDVDPLLDILSFAIKRINEGGWEERVVSEAMTQIDEYIMCLPRSKED